MSLSATPVQSCTGSTGNVTAGSYTATFGATPTQGNFILAATQMSTSSGAGGKITATNITFYQIANWGTNATQAASSILWLGLVGASAGSVITVSIIGSVNQAMVGVFAEFTGINVRPDLAGDANTGNSASASVTISAGNVANALLVAALSNRGAYATTGQTVFSSPTNSFSIIGQDNTNINTANSDRSVAMLVRLVSSTSSVSAGASLTSAQWSATGARLIERPTAANISGVFGIF